MNFEISIYDQQALNQSSQWLKSILAESKATTQEDLKAMAERFEHLNNWINLVDYSDMDEHEIEMMRGCVSAEAVRRENFKTELTLWITRQLVAIQQSTSTARISGR